LLLFVKKEVLPASLERDRMRLRQSRGPIALQVIVLAHDSRFGLRQLEAIML
jgi:hypothetical protein